MKGPKLYEKKRGKKNWDSAEREGRIHDFTSKKRRRGKRRGEEGGGEWGEAAYRARHVVKGGAGSTPAKKERETTPRRCEGRQAGERTEETSGKVPVLNYTNRSKERQPKDEFSETKKRAETSSLYPATKIINSVGEGGNDVKRGSMRKAATTKNW